MRVMGIALPAFLVLLVFAGSVSGHEYREKEPRLYLSAGGALVLPADARASGHDIDTGQPARANVSFDTGHGLVLVMGYGEKTGGVRGELEFGYRTFAIDKFSNLRVGNRTVRRSAEVGGDVTAFSLMGNVVSSLPLGPVNVYVGGGIGIARVEAEWHSLAGISFPEVDYRDDVFAWQLLTGLQYHLSGYWSAQLGYRYFTTEGARLSRSGTPAESHSLELSVTHWLN